jgi:hypothetical protein
MNACKLRDEAIGGAVRSRTGKMLEVGEGGAGSVCVKVGVQVDILAACKLDIDVSGRSAFTFA